MKALVDYEKLFNSGKWMIRTSDNGKSFKDFIWKPQGQWTKAPDWNAEPLCGNGLHGQNAQAYGYFQISGNRLELCETDDTQVIIDGDKLKTPRAKIIAINEEIPLMFLTAIELKFKDNIPFLRNLTSVGGGLSIYAKAKLPALTSVGGGLSIYAKAELPTLTSVRGYLSICANAELPALTSVGGGLSISAKAELPALTSVGGGLSIYAKAELPALTSVGGGLSISANAELPALTSVRGYLSISANAELPALTSVGGRIGKFINNRFREVKANK